MCSLFTHQVYNKNLNIIKYILQRMGLHDTFQHGIEGLDHSSNLHCKIFWGYLNNTLFNEV